MNKPVVSTQKLIKNFGSGDNETKVLRGLDINIYPGEFLIVFGPSGSGKSTLLNILSGLETQTAGTVIVDGQDLTTMTATQRSEYHRDKIGMVFQSYNLIPSLTVIQNITLPLMFARIPHSERDRKALELLREFDLERLAHRLPSEISGGQAQRVGIMRALINNPPIIIADEPTGNLDSITTKNVMNMFSDLNDRYHNTLIVVTHDAALFTYADRIIFIIDGQVVKEKTHRRTTGHRSQSQLPFDRLHQKHAQPSVLKILDILSVILNRHQLAAFDETELLKTVSFFQSRLDGTISNDELLKLLDKPSKKGGAGLYHPTAEYLVDSLDHILTILK